MANTGAGMDDGDAQSPVLLEEVMGTRSDSKPFNEETLPGATPPRHRVSTQSTELTRGPPELVQHFRL
jgi:hypothetical protein